MMAVVQSLCIAAVLLAGCSSDLTAQAAKNRVPTQPRSTLEGVYTAAQAARGEKVQLSECSMCHSPREDFTRSSFLGNWSGKTVHDLVENLRNTMPQDTPGSLSRQQYTDIVAYILKLNGMPAGKAELKSDEKSLRQIVIQRSKK